MSLTPGHIFISDQGNCAVRQLNLATSQVPTIAGPASNCTRVDGAIASAGFGPLIGIYYSPVYGLFAASGDWGGGGYPTSATVRLIH